jgi:hypothetical protein
MRHVAWKLIEKPVWELNHSKLTRQLESVDTFVCMLLLLPSLSLSYLRVACVTRVHVQTTHIKTIFNKTSFHVDTRGGGVVCTNPPTCTLLSCHTFFYRFVLSASNVYICILTFFLVARAGYIPGKNTADLSFNYTRFWIRHRFYLTTILRHARKSKSRIEPLQSTPLAMSLFILTGSWTLSKRQLFPLPKVYPTHNSKATELKFLLQG